MGPCFGQWALRIIIKWQWTYGYQKILIEEIILCTTYKNHWATTELTCYVLYEWSMAETNIYSIEWELRWWFSACHCERNVSLYDARCTITNGFCTQQSTVGLPYAICMMIYMLKQTYILNNELGDMSSCTSAMWQYEPRYAQITNENWVIFFNFTQQSTLLQRYLWDERSLMDAWDQVVLIMRNHIIQTVNGAIDHSEVV